jgi:CheY-like chemotaxis protein
MRVLVADDSKLLVQRLVVELAKIKGVELVGQAGSVDEAVQELRILKPDVLILDIAMPGGCGLNVLEQMPSGGAAPIVIVLTNYGIPQYRKRCFELGARYFFDKSTEFDAVRGVLTSLVESQASGRRDGNSEEECGPSETVPASQLRSDGDLPFRGAGGPVGRPHLIVARKGNQQAVYYRCSHCQHKFHLPDDAIPRVAATELIRGFREHVQQNHPDSDPEAVCKVQD